jgi:hypothetical protein
MYCSYYNNTWVLQIARAIEDEQIAGVVPHLVDDGLSIL